MWERLKFWLMGNKDCAGCEDTAIQVRDVPV